MNGLRLKPYLYRGSPDLIALNERIVSSRPRVPVAPGQRRAMRRLGLQASGSCPLPCCPNDSAGGLPCPECRDALGPMLRLADVPETPWTEAA